MKRLAILGSTGSIGKSTLQVAKHLKSEIQVVALAAKSNIDLLEQQVLEFHPQLVAVFDENAASILQKRLPNTPVVAGLDGLIAVATFSEADSVMSALVGTAGMLPTVKAIQACKSVALANKEVLVAAGAIVSRLAKENGVPLIPVDSEHSAIFQCLQGQYRPALARIILTASGGAFRNYTADQLQTVTVAQALKHPNWSMGPKVTIDSSTLMNKGLEAIEAHWLFDMPPDQIDVVIHPQSIIHSMVEFTDGSLLAQMGEPDMIVPIQYALTYPERRSGLMPRFDFTKHAFLQFDRPDLQRFRCLKLAFDAMKVGGSLPCYMNAVNEELVQLFQQGRISWIEIGTLLESAMERHAVKQLHSIEEILDLDREARKTIFETL